MSAFRVALCCCLFLIAGSTANAKKVVVQTVRMPDGSLIERKIPYEPWLAKKQAEARLIASAGQEGARVLQLVNQYRAQYGRGPLRMDATLNQWSSDHCSWMAGSGLRHGNYPCGENIAMGQSGPDEVMQDWMNSPGHRANILDSQYTRMGIARIESRRFGTMWTQQFLQ